MDIRDINHDVLDLNVVTAYTIDLKCGLCDTTETFTGSSEDDVKDDIFMMCWREYHTETEVGYCCRSCVTKHNYSKQPQLTDY